MKNIAAHSLESLESRTLLAGVGEEVSKEASKLMTTKTVVNTVLDTLQTSAEIAARTQDYTYLGDQYFIAGELVSATLAGKTPGLDTPLTINSIFPLIAKIVQADRERMLLNSLHILTDFTITNLEGDALEIAQKNMQTFRNTLPSFVALAIAAKHGMEFKTMASKMVAEYQTTGSISLKHGPTASFATQLIAEGGSLYYQTASIATLSQNIFLGYLAKAVGFGITAELASHWNEPQHATKTTGAYAVETLVNVPFIIGQVSNFVSFALMSKAIISSDPWFTSDKPMLKNVKDGLIAATVGAVTKNIITPFAQGLYTATVAPYMASSYHALHQSADAASKWTYTNIGQPIQKALKVV